MNVVLLEPTDKDIMTRSLELRGNTLEPYAIESIGAYVRTNIPNITVNIVQQYNLNDIQLIDSIADFKPDILGISPLTSSIDRAYVIARELKNRFSSLKVVFGGQHASLVPEEVAQNLAVDFVVMGEGELTFAELLYHLISGTPSLENINGLCFRGSNNIIVRNAPRARVANLDSLPYPIRVPEILKRSRNWNLAFPAPDMQTGVAQINFSRGCPYSCSFCVSPVLWSQSTDASEGKGMTFRSPKSVTNEIKQIKQEHNINFFYFNDVTFNQSPRRMRELCNQIISDGLHEPGEENDPTHIDKHIHWFCLAKIGVNPADAKLLADAGCVKMGFGIESFDENTLGSFHKSFNNGPSIEETLSATDAVGIFNRVYIIIGSPNESVSHFEMLREKLLAMPVDQIRVAFLATYPNTPLYNRWKGLLTSNNYAEYTEDIPILKCENISHPELFVQRRKLIRDFYTSKEYHARMLSKIERFPHLRHSYEHFLQELREVSKGEINISLHQRAVYAV